MHLLFQRAAAAVAGWEVVVTERGREVAGLGVVAATLLVPGWSAAAAVAAVGWLLLAAQRVVGWVLLVQLLGWWLVAAVAVG